MKRLLPILLLLSAGISVSAQNAMPASETGRQIRSLPKEKALEAEGRPAFQSLRIEDGKVWINGNLAQKSELPEKLHRISSDLVYQASMYGVSEMEFSLMGSDFLLKNGRLVELPSSPGSGTGLVQSNTLTQQDYYSNLRDESPSLFMQINREAMLTEQYMNLVMAYDAAPNDRRPAIEEQLRAVLGELFDISLANMELELRELEQEVNFIRESIDERRSNRTQIIQAKLDEVRRK